jgi:hypothetical protein
MELEHQVALELTVSFDFQTDFWNKPAILMVK